MLRALRKRYITQKECTVHTDRYIIIGKMLTKFIQHLRNENRRERG